MKLKKTHMLGAVAAVVTAAAIAVGVNAARAEPAPDDTVSLVDESVPQHELLDDVLAIDAQRNSGGFGFAYVPKARPADLQRMITGTSGDAVVDGYHLGGQPSQVFVEYAAQPTGTCDSLRTDPGTGLCLQSRTLTNDDTKMHNVTVYLSQVGISAPTATDPATSSLRAFWSSTELIPTHEAAWFADLLTQAKAAPKKKLG
jgi:hypothetical protein